MRAFEGEVPLPADMAERIFGHDPLEQHPLPEDLWEQAISYLDGHTEKPGRGATWYRIRKGEIEGNFRYNNPAQSLEGRKFSEKQTRDLIEKAQSGDAEARSKVILDNLGLINHVLRNPPITIPSPALDSKDLFIEGVFGLDRAISKFDLGLNNKLSGYAILWIEQVIRLAIMNQARTVRLPVRVESQLSRVLGTDKNLALSPQHTESDVAAKAGVSDEHLANIRLAQHLFMDMLPIEIAECVAEDEDESEVGVHHDFRRIVNEMLTATNESGEPIITEREQVVLRLRFGIEDARARTLKDIGEQLGFTGTYARVVVERAMKKIGQFYRIEDFFDYLD